MSYECQVLYLALIESTCAICVADTELQPPPPTPLAKTHIPHGIRAPMGGSFRWNCVVYNTPPVGVSNVWTYPQFEAPEHLIPVGTHADATTHASSARMDGSRRKLSGGTSSRKVGDEQKCDDKPCVLYQPRSADSARL